jgi:hypothetical protein
VLAFSAEIARKQTVIVIFLKKLDFIGMQEQDTAWLGELGECFYLLFSEQLFPFRVLFEGWQ